MYAEQAAIYRSDEERTRIEICVRQQALIFAADGRLDIAALGSGVTAGVYADIDAVVAAVIAGPNWASLGEDADLLSAVQGAWPAVAAARYGG